MNNDLYDIDIVSERVGVTPAIVRRYTRLRMVLPGARRGRQALYTAADLARLRKIVRLTRDLGLNGVGVQVVLRLLDQIEVLEREMAVLRLRERAELVRRTW